VTESRGVRELAAEMRRAIDSYLDGALSLSRAMWELRGLISVLRPHVDTEWADELKSKWNELEYVNALFIDSGRDSLTSEETDEVTRTMVEFKLLLTEY
jgi:hypothetical protein